MLHGGQMPWRDMPKTWGKKISKKVKVAKKSNSVFEQ